MRRIHTSQSSCWERLSAGFIRRRFLAHHKPPCITKYHFTDSPSQSLETPSLKICEVIFSDARMLVLSKETSSDETCRETFWATDLQGVYSSHRFKPFFGLSSLKSLFLWNLRKDIWEGSLEYGERNILKENTEGSFLWNCSVSS